MAVPAVCAASAGAVSFGADLSAPTQNTYRCRDIYPGASSCLVYSSYYAPASGTVTAVRVKTGAVGGPMQVVVLTSLYQNHYGDPGHPYFACCFVAAYGPQFNAPPDTIVTVPTSLPMVEQPTPPPDDFTTNARGDSLALSVLDGNALIPANQDGANFIGTIVPAPTPATVPAPSPNPLSPSEALGYHVNMNADLNTTGGGGGGGGGAGGGGAGGGGGGAHPLTIGNGGQLVGTTASVPLTCVLTTACDGMLRLTDKPAGAAAAKKKSRKPTVYGTSGHFSIAAGKTQSVKIKLNAAGRKKLRGHRSLTLTATATLGSQVVSSRVTLKHKGKGK